MIKGLEIRPDDLTSPETQALVARHLTAMHAHSPPGSVHALDVAQLKAGGLAFWSASVGGRIVGMGALKRLDDRSGEIKSMRVADAFLGQGVGRAILRRIVEEARATRTSVGLFDIGHMGRIELVGEDHAQAADWVVTLALTPGAANVLALSRHAAPGGTGRGASRTR